ncbi:hypothetical protein HSB1_16670 [Halogranum salarium B-1]|uniref:Uncharacterized protein n=1 Tax=Halogranum salarium B-1 TaxID=1210908 RepID=J3JFS5_9EURY|nr:hypothetical protein HSB1_16670 [Halogranum salarium B-1]
MVRATQLDTARREPFPSSHVVQTEGRSALRVIPTYRLSVEFGRQKALSP